MEISDGYISWSSCTDGAFLTGTDISHGSKSYFTDAEKCDAREHQSADHRTMALSNNDDRPRT
jgi:hypothetical protein